MGRTVNFAAKKLPEKARKPFLRIWEACNCADLYDGNLATYLSVMAQSLESRNEERETLKNIASDIQKKLKRVHLISKKFNE